MEDLRNQPLSIIGMKASWLFAVIALFVVGVIVDIAFQQELRDSSADLAVWMQDHTSQTIKQLYLFIADFSIALLPLMPIVIFYNINKILGIEAMFVFVWGIGINAFMKNIYSYPRPFWAYDEVALIGSCATDWGNPSGHVQSTATCFVYLAIVVIAWYQPSTLNKFLIWVSTITMLVLVALCRVYLGVHFYGQVLLGFLYATLGICVITYFEAPLTNLLRTQLPKIKFQFILHVIWILFAISTVLIDQNRDPAFSKDWTERIETKCGKLDIGASVPQQDAITLCAMFALVPAAAFGYYITPSASNSTSGCKRFLCVLITYVIVGVLVFVTEDLRKLPKGGLFVFEIASLAYYSIGLIFSGVLPVIYTQLGLMEDDYRADTSCPDGERELLRLI